jgi:hypothetical protein
VDSSAVSDDWTSGPSFTSLGFFLPSDERLEKLEKKMSSSADDVM